MSITAVKRTTGQVPIITVSMPSGCVAEHGKRCVILHKFITDLQFGLPTGASALWELVVMLQLEVLTQIVLPREWVFLIPVASFHWAKKPKPRRLLMDRISMTVKLCTPFKGHAAATDATFEGSGARDCGRSCVTRTGALAAIHTTKSLPS